MKIIKNILLVFGLSFFLVKNVYALSNYISTDNLEEVIKQSYTGLVEYNDNILLYLQLLIISISGIILSLLYKNNFMIINIKD